MHSVANLRAATSRVELLGSPSVVQQVKSIMRFMDRQWAVAQSPNRMNVSSAENLQDIVDAELRWVLDDFRYDLGVADKIDETELARRLAIRETYLVTHSGNMPTSTTQQGH